MGISTQTQPNFSQILESVSLEIFMNSPNVSEGGTSYMRLTPVSKALSEFST